MRTSCDTSVQIAMGKALQKLAALSLSLSCCKEERAAAYENLKSFFYCCIFNIVAYFASSRSML